MLPAHRYLELAGRDREYESDDDDDHHQDRRDDPVRFAQRLEPHRRRLFVTGGCGLGRDIRGQSGPARGRRSVSWRAGDAAIHDADGIGPIGRTFGSRLTADLRNRLGTCRRRYRFYVRRLRERARQTRPVSLIRQAADEADELGLILSTAERVPEISRARRARNAVAGAVNIVAPLRDPRLRLPPEPLALRSGRLAHLTHVLFSEALEPSASVEALRMRSTWASRLSEVSVAMRSRSRSTAVCMPLAISSRNEGSRPPV